MHPTVPLPWIIFFASMAGGVIGVALGFAIFGRPITIKFPPLIVTPNAAEFARQLEEWAKEAGKNAEVEGKP